MERIPSKKNPEGKKIPDFCAQKSQTRGLVWVTRGPIETIFVKKNFKIRVKLRQNFFALACLGEKVKLCCRQARAKFFDANFENCFNKNCFYGSSGDPHQTSSLRLLCTKIGDFFSLRFEDLMVSFQMLPYTFAYNPLPQSFLSLR